MSKGARYTPPGPDAEAAIEVEIENPDGVVYLRIPASTFAEAFGTVGDSREQLFGAFISRKFGIWPKLASKVSKLLGGEMYTVLPRDLM
jgi:hypothetical protein